MRPPHRTWPCVPAYVQKNGKKLDFIFSKD
jgi:hypothetical protein